jgi:hypothetical protein
MKSYCHLQSWGIYICLNNCIDYMYIYMCVYYYATWREILCQTLFFNACSTYAYFHLFFIFLQTSTYNIHTIQKNRYEYFKLAQLYFNSQMNNESTKFYVKKSFQILSVMLQKDEPILLEMKQMANAISLHI